jgi:peptidoglycan-associated lipoprotein
MKKVLAVSLLVGLSALCVTPACKKKKNEKKPIKVAHNIPLSGAAKANYIDEGADAFLLDEDAQKVASDVSWVAQNDAKGYQRVQFDYDRYVVRADQETAVSKDISVAKNSVKQGNQVVVEGHACEIGAKAYNLLLSEKRAQAVASRLEKEGVARSNMKIVGRGNEMAIVHGGDREHQSPNRRVEMFEVAA